MSSKMKIMIAPGRYVQGSGAVKSAGEHVKLLGKKALIWVAKEAWAP
jgi:glycerol dehydrogenase